jgi:hypothetical protein
MTEIHMRSAAFPLHEMLGGALSNRDRDFRTAAREAIEGAGLVVKELFPKSPVPQDIPEVLPDGTRESTSYILLTIGIDIDAAPETIEQVFTDLSVPGFPATAWKFPED